MSATDTVRDLTDRLAGAEVLDTVGKPVATWVTGRLGTGVAKDVLSGTWMGHPLHPMLTDLPIGFWTSAFALDLVGGKRSAKAAQRLVALGVLSALPTAAAGLSDWSDTIGDDRRLGTAHALGNTVALAFYVLSWRARRRGHRARGILLGFVGAGAASVGGYLGGHLVFRKGVGADRNAWKHGSDDWVDVGDPASLVSGGGPVVVTVGDDEVLVVGDGAGFAALSNICGHAGGPLDEGTFEDGCVTCPWHGSVFRLADGGLVHGPATGPQPRYDVRTEDGRLMVRRSQASG